MVSKKILNQIRLLEITTKRLLKGTLVGDHRSAQKGTGLEFEQIREYQQGDDIRFIDWKSSARMNKILVKEYIEERSRTIMLVVDCSASTWFGSQAERKYDRMAQIASVISLVAHFGKDYVGLMLFSDKVHTCIPPARGSKHIHKIMEELLSVKQKNTTTDISSALDHVMRMKQKNMSLFIVSDFFAEDFEKKLRVVGRLHDTVAVRVLDTLELNFPSVGLLMMRDIETKKNGYVQTGKQDDINLFLVQFAKQQEQKLASCGVDCFDVRTDRPFMGDLIQFFRQRMRY